MATNPLLLTLICLAFEDTLSFPSRRSEIYRDAIFALLKKWDASRGIRRDEIYRNLTSERKEHLFATIAINSFIKAEYLFRQDDLEKRIVDYLTGLPPDDVNYDIDGEAILKSIEVQHGIFVERAKSIYSFAHLTFQEYFTAKYLITRGSIRLVASFLQDKITISRWREIILLTSEMMLNAKEFFHFFLKNQEKYLSRNVRIFKFVEIVVEYSKRVKYFRHVLRKKIITAYLVIKIANEMFGYLKYDKGEDTGLYLERSFNKISKIAIRLGILSNRIDIIGQNKIRQSDFEDEKFMSNDESEEYDDIEDLGGDEIDDFDTEKIVDIARDISVASEISNNMLLDILILETLKEGGMQYYYEALNIANKLGYKDLVYLKPKLNEWGEIESYDEWLNFETDLIDIAKKYRNYDIYIFRGEEARLLYDYICSIELLLDCLKIAYFKERSDIFNTMVEISENMG